MPAPRTESIVIAAGLLAWVGIFVASWQGKLGVSWVVSDGLLAFLAIVIAYRLWRVCRLRGRKRA
jgi:membrane protein implicated in regulation of membrane protease activity